MPTSLLSATEPSLLNEAEAAILLSVSPGTLSVWRCTRRYPLPYLKVGRLVRYRRIDIERFLAARMVTPGAAAD